MGHRHCLFQPGTLGPIPQCLSSHSAHGMPVLRAFWGTQGTQLCSYRSSQLLAEAERCKNRPWKDAGPLTAQGWCSCAASPAPKGRAGGPAGWVGKSRFLRRIIKAWGMQVIHPGLRLPVLLPAWAAYTPASSLDAFLRRPAVPSSARGRPLQGLVGGTSGRKGGRGFPETEIEIKPVDSNRGSLSNGKCFMPSSHLHSWMPDHQKKALVGQDISCALPLRSCHGLYSHSTVIDRNQSLMYLS